MQHQINIVKVIRILYSNENKNIRHDLIQFTDAVVRCTINDFYDLQWI